MFYDQNWTEIGTRGALEEQIESTTGIRNVANFEQASVAQKMSWPSKWKTTREEDTAYCLMDLFGVNMPALYGEGQNAFRRLQLQILQQSDDESIFAWKWPSDLAGGLLAPSPAAFEDSGDVQRVVYDESRAQYTMTNKGLRMDLFLIAKYTVPSVTAKMFLAPLNCMRSDELQDEKNVYPLAIWLKHVGSDQYIRISYGELLPTLWSTHRAHGFVKRTIYIRDAETLDLSPPQPCTFSIKFPALYQHGFFTVQLFLKNIGNILPVNLLLLDEAPTLQGASCS
jgi:hypothetical protein